MTLRSSDALMIEVIRLLTTGEAGLEAVKALDARLADVKGHDRGISLPLYRGSLHFRASEAPDLRTRIADAILASHAGLTMSGR